MNLVIMLMFTHLNQVDFVHFLSNLTKLYQPVTYSVQLLSSQVHQIEAILEMMMDMGPSLDQITKTTHHNQNQTVIMRSMYRLWKKADPNILK